MASTLGAFAFRRRLTIDTTSSGANIAGTLSSFPVCVAVTSTSWGAAGSGHLFDVSNTAGKRVQFFDSSGTNLAYEVESYDSSGGTAIYWVNVPTVTGNSTTTIDVGYGSDPNGSDQSQGTAVWDSGFKAVYHLSGTSGTGDSTSNGNTLTYTGGTAYTGLVGTSVSFNGTSDRAQANDSASLGMSGATAFTISAFVNPSSLPTSGKQILNVLNKYDTNNTIYQGYEVQFKYQTATTSFWVVGWANTTYAAESVSSPVFTPTAGSDYHIAGVKDNTSGYFYQNGGAVSTAVLSSNGLNYGLAKKLNIANFGLYNGTELGRYFPGRIGEVRIQQTARSADWIKAEYFSMKQTSWAGDGWLTVGPEQWRKSVYARTQAVTRAASW